MTESKAILVAGALRLGGNGKKEVFIVKIIQ